MKIHVDLEIPNWTRWVLVGILAGVGLEYGIANVHAEIDAGTSDEWQSGERLTADKLNRSFDRLQNALDAQQQAISSLQQAVNALRTPDCPIGYGRDGSVSAFVVCKKGSDELVQVGTGGAAFWVDRYEASIWDKVTDGWQRGLQGTNDFPSSYPRNGQYATNGELFALSVAGVQPSIGMTWFQAQAACRASGKRLPGTEEWFAAASGTPDPGNHDGSDGQCVTRASAARTTGLGSKCQSRWGAEDMVGNLWEWIAEWHAGPGSSAEAASWPDLEYNSDGTWNIMSSAASAGMQDVVGLPAVAVRGGSYGIGTGAGLFSLSLGGSAAYPDITVGFRCVVLR